ncbi:helix-turn-helix domain-containing protein [Cryobacterium zhongshanensis]|uniref:Helix-turn-helix domain-containing protein n=1 Tax=Cryobacterium zhongshanensis TaxID=2928153 RepID=A0AA41QY71_9MICO|nr:helix-turn-helix domain-containing protein [Cryobacterium zhongshanensis]MCI4659936.1 helix-turn-helix domain-containing protein [Cryobacterium zhongshanensis]
MNARDAYPGLGRFLTLGDTADILALTVAEVSELVHTGELPAIRIGPSAPERMQHWRVERVVLESYIEAKYEEARRLSLWEQSDYANIPELSGGTIIRPVD